MILTLSLEIVNIFKAKPFVDKDTGESKAQKWKIQAFDNVETENGTQMKLIDVSIPDEKYYELKDSVGKEVSIPVKTYVSKGRVGYYGI